MAQGRPRNAFEGIQQGLQTFLQGLLLRRQMDQQDEELKLRQQDREADQAYRDESLALARSEAERRSREAEQERDDRRNSVAAGAFSEFLKGRPQADPSLFSIPGQLAAGAQPGTAQDVEEHDGLKLAVERAMEARGALKSPHPASQLGQETAQPGRGLLGRVERPRPVDMSRVSELAGPSAAELDEQRAVAVERERGKSWENRELLRTEGRLSVAQLKANADFARERLKQDGLDRRFDAGLQTRIISEFNEFVRSTGADARDAWPAFQAQRPDLFPEGNAFQGLGNPNAESTRAVQGSQVDLNQARTGTEGARQRNLDALTRLAGVRADEIEALAPLKGQELTARIGEIAARTGHRQALTQATLLDMELDKRGADREDAKVLIGQYQFAAEHALEQAEFDLKEAQAAIQAAVNQARLQGDANARIVSHELTRANILTRQAGELRKALLKAEDPQVRRQLTEQIGALQGQVDQIYEAAQPYMKAPDVQLPQVGTPGARPQIPPPPIIAPNGQSPAGPAISAPLNLRQEGLLSDKEVVVPVPGQGGVSFLRIPRFQRFTVSREVRVRKVQEQNQKRRQQGRPPLSHEEQLQLYNTLEYYHRNGIPF